MSENKVDPGQVLRKVPIFSGLSDVEWNELSQRVVPRKYPNGEMIFSEGDACAGLFVVQSGHIRIFKSSASGREQVLSIDGPGSSVAELPVFDGGSYPASAVAVTDCTLLFLSKQDFHALCMKYPEMALKVLRVVGGRLRRLVGIIEELSFTTVRHRLVALLLRLAKTEGNKTEQGITITLPAHNQELAAQIGTVRELVSRNMSRLQQEGMIEQDGRTVILKDPMGLQRTLEEAG
ncbi:transcriptional regulator, Crp/Fnr family [Candidatus Koribacter versatilis Ellin345]|uniref:Transcriptional regulator, Crp/Fnr family n=1 Tax=Koribacter versatilis (strain Ellin345) TaxID=204669 RepID=Q1IUT3_KORVE|nr:Crp/Fnr family transcriptional regulator [Candidatus Koribacter versatilis]ABF39367.1 transcriptional regulator, Crp/Fnr family [Candidatus Koribacter versatilis Ellin345]